MNKTKGQKSKSTDSAEDIGSDLVHVSKKRLMEIGNLGVEILEAPYKSPHDKKEYRVIRLKNGLRVLLISDLANLKQKNSCSAAATTNGDSDDSEESLDEEEEEEEDDDGEEEEEDSEEEVEMVDILEEEKKVRKLRKTRYLSAASLCIGVGSFEDPREIQGLMHFLEHMVFMGSEKYPRENCFDNYIKKCGGGDNAHTDYENTTFYFDVQEMHFEKALDMFAHFFVSPLMKEEAMQRERKAVHSEFEGALNDDDCRKQQVLASAAAGDEHPMSLFTFGNETTLQLEISDTELHSKLHQIRSQFYSAQYMTLAVQARETLGVLQDMVVQTFSKVPNNGLPKPSYTHFGSPFQGPSFRRLYKVIPVNDRHTLDINWALPCLFKHYESKPLHYISYLIGHEGLGSIMSYFKKRVWAVDIYAGNDESGFEHNTTYALFNIRITLTDTGFANIREVTSLVFQYLSLLRKEGPSERIFKEIQQVERINFEYAEERCTSDNVQELSEEMQLYPPEHVLCGSTLLFKYDPEVITDCLSRLQPSSCNLVISSKEYHGKVLPLQEEKWFGTKYCVQDIPSDWLSEWESSAIDPSLHLPFPNDFIPDDFAVLPCPPSATPSPQYPTSVLKDCKGELWYKQDFKFNLPRAYCYIYFFLEPMKESPKMGAMLDLFLNLFLQHIMEALYPTTMAQYETHLKAVEWGFILQVNGFNQKLFKCLEMILSQIEDFEKCLDDTAFEEMKQQQIKGYHNTILSPDMLRRDARLVLLQEVHWLVTEKMTALTTLTKKDFLSEFLRRMFSVKYIKMLVQGNISEDEAKRMYHLVAHETAKSEGEVECPQMRIRKCQLGEWVSRVKSLNPASANSSVVNYYQGERSTLTTELLNEFIIMTMDEPVFDTLRTKEQLGYHVYCTSRNTFGILGISITVNSQANKYSSSHVNERIEAFLKVFSENLKNVSEDEMETMKETLRNFKLTVDLTLKEETDRNWEEVMSGDCLFDRHVQQLPLIASITSQQVSSYLQGIISQSKNASYRKLSVQVEGAAEPKDGVVPCHEDTLKRPSDELLQFLSPSDEDSKSGLKESQFIRDLRGFGKGMIYFQTPSNSEETSNSQASKVTSKETSNSEDSKETSSEISGSGKATT